MYYKKNYLTGKSVAMEDTRWSMPLEAIPDSDLAGVSERLSVGHDSASVVIGSNLYVERYTFADSAR
jgi:hypothetical protein